MPNDPEKTIPPSRDQRKLSRRHLLAGTALATGAGIAAWQVLGDQDAGQPELDNSETPTFSPDTAAAAAGSASPTPQITDVVGDGGFDIVLGRVRVSAPAGVAETGTLVTVSIPQGSAPANVGALATLVGQPVSIVLGDEVQPNQPVTIHFDLTGTGLAAQVSEASQLVLISSSGRSNELAVETGVWDAQTETFTATTDHLSGFWAGLINVGKYILEAFQRFQGLTFSKPDRAFAPLSINSRSYTIAHAGGEAIWPQLVNDRGRLAVELHSNSNMAWAVATAPSVTGNISGGWKDLNVGIAAIYQGLFDILGQDRAALMPGGLVRLPFDASAGSIRIEARQSPILFNVTMVLQAVISVLQALPTGRVADAVLDSFSAFDCITEVINTFYGDETAEISRSIVLSILSCVAAMIEEQKGGSKLVLKTALAVMAMLSVAVNTIIGAAQGVWREVTGTALVAYTITTDAPGSRADDPVTTAIGPGHDAPIAVKWRYDQSGWILQPPTIDNGVLFLSTLGPFTAIDIASGEMQWEYHSLFETPKTPVMFDDLAIVQAEWRGGSKLQAFDRFTGIERWHIGPGLERLSDIAIANGRGWVTANDTLYSIDPRTGGDFQEIQSKMWGAPVASEGMVFAHGYMTDPVRGALLVGFDASTGERQWSQTDFPGLAPLAAGSSTVFAGGITSYYAIEASDGSTRWKIPSPDRVSTKPTMSNGLVFITLDGSLTALDLQSGEQVWSFSPGPNEVILTQTIASDVLYVGSAMYLFALDSRTGNEHWRYQANNDPSWPITDYGGPAIAAGGGIVCAVYSKTSLVTFGNVQPMRLVTETTLRGAPSETSVERGKAAIGDSLVYLGTQIVRGSTTWIEVSNGGIRGWIPLNAIEGSSLPPSGDLEYVYVPG